MTDLQVQVKEFENLNIFQIRLPLPFRLNHVNCYAVRDKKGWYLIDTGLNYPDARRCWEKAMEILGMKPVEIKGIYLTHNHPDHYGMAGYLQQLSGAPVFISEIDAEVVEIIWVNYKENIPEMGELFVENGMAPELANSAVESMMEMPGRVRPLAELTLIDNNQQIKLGDNVYETIWTPGHSDGHMCFFCRETGVLFSGDHLLPKITSNIGLWPYSMQNPLKNFLSSIEKIKKLPVKLVLPAHGSPFTDHAERVEQLVEHHKERLKLMFGYVEDSGTTAFDICTKVFSPNLNMHELRFAMVETLAHLAFLEEEKKIEPCAKGNLIVYKKV